MTYKEARVYLDEMSKYGSVLGLDTIRGLLRELGNPQDDLKFIHIAGTNGKGSVLAYTSTILSEAGYRIGRYVSPTVVSYLERIQVDSEWISGERFANLTEKVRDAIARLEAEGRDIPTVFEIETAIAFLYFKEMQCDLVVLEAGLGGALDATNIIKNTVCAVFASISRDHIGMIGDTVEEITRNKAGIIKPGCEVVSAEQEKSVEQILRQCAAEQGCTYVQAQTDQIRVIKEDYHGIYFSYKIFQNMHTVMAGKNQLSNLAAALEVIRMLGSMGYEISIRDVRRGMERTLWPGRFTCIGENPVFILDGAHNEDAALKLKESMEAYFPGRRLLGIAGVFRDKEYDRIAQTLGPLCAKIYTVDLPNRDRGLSARRLAGVFRAYCGCVEAPEEQRQQEQTVGDAVAAALKEAGSRDVIVAFGSLSYLYQVKAAYEREIRGENR
nr:folylpolyglutamate synthase/dihydrofolate synthase family protein [uncultured Mediterraneibacter sp.]